MKTLNIILSLLIFLFSGVLLAQDTFEGKVKFDVREDDNKQVMDYYAKDKKYRMEMPDKGGAILFDSNKLMMYVRWIKKKCIWKAK